MTWSTRASGPVSRIRDLLGNAPLVTGNYYKQYLLVEQSGEAADSPNFVLVSTKISADFPDSVH